MTEKPSKVGRGNGKTSKTGLVALGTAAVLSIYGAGFLRTQAAAQRIDRASQERRSLDPAPVIAPVATAPEPDLTVGAAPTLEAAVSQPVVASTTPAETAAVATPAPMPIPDLAASVATAPPPPSAPEPVEAPPVVSAPVPPPVVSAPPPVETQPAPASKYKDGRYTGWGTSRHGDIQATVEIEGGRILSATISSCRTRYPCSRIDRIVPQVAERQSPEVDNVSRATQSADAFYYAVLEALKKAQ